MKMRALDPLLGTPARLAIMATLADGHDWTFTELREATGLADGNLHVQTSKLAEGGYVKIRKIKRGSRTATCFRAEDEGGVLAHALLVLPDGARERLDPVDRICDSAREEFAVEVAWPPAEGPAGAEPWRLRLEVWDLAGNLAVAEGEAK